MTLPNSQGDEADAFVLAGGLSSRMGQDKSLVALHGSPLIHHVLTILRAAGLHPRVAGARSADLAQFAPVLPDDLGNAGCGPLAGICSGLAAATRRYSVFIPVDLPMLPSNLISYLIHHAVITESPVALFSICGFTQTFPVVFDSATAPNLHAALASGRLKCLAAFQSAASALSRPLNPIPLELLIQAGQIADSAGRPPYLWFRNLNTPEDLERLTSSSFAHVD